MELRRLRYFLSIAAEGSLGKASRVLGIAQPAIGRQIQMMEAELGVQLFSRVPKGMVLTDEGEYLKQALEHPLELVNIALRNVKTHTLPIEAALTLGIPLTISQFIGQRLIVGIQERLPSLRLKISEGDSSTLASGLSRGIVDIALLIGIFPADKVFHQQVIRERLMLVMLPDAPQSQASTISFSDMSRLPLILPGTHAELRTQLTRAELSAGTNLEIALEIDSVELRKQAVLAGLGYAVLPPLAFRAEADQRKLVGVPIIEPAIEQIIRFAVRPLWRVPRTIYDEVERTILEELHRAVTSGSWPGDWLVDFSQVPSMHRT